MTDVPALPRLRKRLDYLAPPDLVALSDVRREYEDTETGPEAEGEVMSEFINERKPTLSDCLKANGILQTQLAALAWARWVSVDERLPENLDDILMTDSDGVWTGYYATNIHAFRSYELGETVFGVTHWMPLPPAPVTPATGAFEGDAVPKRVRVVKCTNPTHWWANRIGEVFEVDQVYDDASGDVWVFDGDQSYLMSIADTEPVTDEPAPAPARAETESEPR